MLSLLPPGCVMSAHLLNLSIFTTVYKMGRMTIPAFMSTGREKARRLNLVDRLLLVWRAKLFPPVSPSHETKAGQVTTQARGQVGHTPGVDGRSGSCVSCS